MPSEASAQGPGLLTGDWAAAVPGEPARGEVLVPPVAASVEEPASERTGLPPSLGLRVKAAPPPPAVEAEIAEPDPAPPPAPAASLPPERGPEHPTRPRDKHRLDIPADAEFNGEMLRLVRESYGLSLQQVAERTRITRIHLENVEADRYDKLPATVYLRGILVNLARELRLDPARVSKTYLLAAQRGHVRGS
jgi:hypothetical protein